jgi:hypothetical protein
MGLEETAHLWRSRSTNAANVEMNLTSHQLYSTPPDRAKDLVRYNKPVCDPAGAYCQKQAANSDITEQEIKDMATYQRWVGIPNRSEYQVVSAEVQAGEETFKDLQCNSCHVIDKIAFIKDDNILPDEERDHLERLKIPSGGKTDYPFISYLGADLLIIASHALPSCNKKSQPEISFSRLNLLSGAVVL